MTARQVIEAETPKRALQHAQQQFMGDIWPGRDYYIQLRSPKETWENGEACPVAIRPRNDMDQLDAFYGLIEEIFSHFNIDADVDNAPEYDEALTIYLKPIYASVKRGVTSGTVNGVVGLKFWRLVYDPSGPWRPSAVIPVVAGQRYGEKTVEETEGGS